MYLITVCWPNTSCSMHWLPRANRTGVIYSAKSNRNWKKHEEVHSVRWVSNPAVSRTATPTTVTEILVVVMVIVTLPNITVSLLWLHLLWRFMHSRTYGSRLWLRIEVGIGLYDGYHSRKPKDTYKYNSGHEVLRIAANANIFCKIRQIHLKTNVMAFRLQLYRHVYTNMACCGLYDWMKWWSSDSALYYINSKRLQQHINNLGTDSA